MTMAPVPLRLVPFTVTTATYLLYWIPKYRSSPNDHESYHSVIAKCLPILCLCGFIISYTRNHPVTNYPQFILAGLIFSCFGDAFLVYGHTGKIYFLLGLLSFAIGHMMYTIAFGFNHLKLSVLLFCAPVGIITYIYLLPGLHGELYFFCALYTLLICVMNWGAISRVSLTDIKWPELCGSLGALVFYVSDLVLSINKFLYPVPHGYYIIMSTYYLAQLGISLSVVPTLSMKKLY
ncbi:lysoplasmalogenase TMEM86A-like isoform X2 [Amphiura filiformis]|uniref:lysoplasmalogenase TMEM86A-like isoform X2 n=1 Tax=Amphiura filiformis TaxID=82378 RepID=UPI003B214879